jgi:hypothetical protein
MTQITLVCYRPKEGKAEALIELVKTHVPILLKEDLVTNRTPIIMRAKDGTILEVFEWVSEEAINKAHTNPAVLKMWAEFNVACDYVAPIALAECQHIFSGFEAIN